MWQPRATLIVLTDIDDEHESDFNRWYDQEHIPRRAALPGVRAACRFVRADAPVPPSSSGSPQLLTSPKYMVAYGLDDSSVGSGEAWMGLNGNVTSWFERITPHMRNTTRGGYQHLRSSING